MTSGTARKVGFGSLVSSVLTYLAYAADVPIGLSNVIRWVGLDPAAVGEQASPPRLAVWLPVLSIALLLLGVGLLYVGRTNRGRFRREERVKDVVEAFRALDFATHLALMALTTATTALKITIPPAGFIDELVTLEFAQAYFREKTWPTTSDGDLTDDHVFRTKVAEPRVRFYLELIWFTAHIEAAAAIPTAKRLNKGSREHREAMRLLSRLWGSNDFDSEVTMLEHIIADHPKFVRRTTAEREADELAMKTALERSHRT